MATFVDNCIFITKKLQLFKVIGIRLWTAGGNFLSKLARVYGLVKHFHDLYTALKGAKKYKNYGLDKDSAN